MLRSTLFHHACLGRSAALAISLLTLASASGTCAAGPVDPPTVLDDFGSTTAFIDATALTAWTGAGDIPLDLVLNGPTSVLRELDAVTVAGRDTIDVEIISMSLTGTALGHTVELRAGAGNGFAAGLAKSGGQIREPAGSTPNGSMDDFPLSVGDSFFDVFVEIWIDLDDDGIPDFLDGEVVRSRDAIRMVNGVILPALPPPPGSFYEGNQFISRPMLVCMSLPVHRLPDPCRCFWSMRVVRWGRLHTSISTTRSIRSTTYLCPVRCCCPCWVPACWYARGGRGAAEESCRRWRGATAPMPLAGIRTDGPIAFVGRAITTIRFL